MPSGDWYSPDWVDEPFDRDQARAERWDRADSDELREQDVVDRVRDRAGLPEGSGKPNTEKRAA
jgi:hypothetical protein